MLLSFLFLTSISGAAGAQSIQRIDITEYGIYRAHVTNEISALGTPTGTVALVNEIKLVQATTTVPARLGVSFGIRFKIVGRKGGSVNLKMVTLIPQPGIRNPKTGNTSVRSEYLRTKKINSVHYSDYSFDSPWEIVAGKWTLEIWDGNRKLASQSFNVVAP